MCEIGKSLVIIAGFSDDDDSYDPENLWNSTKVWVMPKCKLCSAAKREVTSYSRYSLEIKGIEIIQKAAKPLNYKTTKREIIKFLNS